MTGVVVDASVWVAAADASDPFSVASRRFLEAAAARRVTFELPVLVRIEVACALARRLRDGGPALAITDGMLRSPLVRVHPLDGAMVEAAVREGTGAFLRAADAVYAALARRLAVELVAWDDELVRRAEAATPEAWLAKRQ